MKGAARQEDGMMNAAQTDNRKIALQKV